MSEVNFSPRRDAEDPLYLDFVASRPQGRQRSARPAGAPDDPDRPLHLDLAMREPRRGKGGAGLIFAGLAALLLAAVAGALYLPSVLHPRQAEPAAPMSTAPAPTAAAPAPTPAAPATANLTPPAQPQPQAPVPQAAAPSAAPAEIAAVPPPPEAPAARRAATAHTRAHAHAKPRAAASKPRPLHAAAAKRPPASHEKSAHAHRAHGVDLDALAKSLQ